jgi:putative ABC transport system permease protein
VTRGASFVAGVARVLLRFYPASFRGQFGAAFVDAASHLWQRERAHASAAAALLRVLWLLALDTLRAAPRAHRAERGHFRNGRAPQFMHVFSWLDFKLGLRMLARYPVLTIVGGLAIAFAIWVGVGTFELTKQWIRPDLKLPEASRLVGVDLWHQIEQEPDYRALYEFTRWRDELRTLAELSAFRMAERNLVSSAAGGAPVNVAEMTASSFRTTRVPAQLGRWITEEDEQPGAAAVVVIGHALWQERFGGADVIGREVRLDDVATTIVGVMPEGYAFPVYHEAWVPLRVNAAALEPGAGPAIRVFGRLADGATLADAQAELSYLGSRVAAEHPAARAQLLPRVLPYTRSIITLSPGDFAGLRWINVAVLLLLALACGNVALLIFARAATRESEIVVRSALGASRGRIIAQLFVEAIVLGAVGAAIGIAAARFGLRFAITLMDVNMGPLPFWVNAQLSAPTLLYAALLTVLTAILAGVIPARRITRGIGTRLRQAGSGGGLKFSGPWTAVIIAQIALTVIGPITALLIWRATAPLTTYDVGFPEHEYLSAGIRLSAEDDMAPDTSPAAFQQRYTRTLEELDRRLSADAAIAGVTFATRLPRMYHPSEHIELFEDATTRHDSAVAHYAKTLAVAADYFDLLGANIVAGHGFSASDAAAVRRVVVVNESFVAEILRGRNPIGHQVRRVPWNADPDATHPEPWHEIVGVVRDVGTYHEGGQAALYYPLQPTMYPAHAIVKVRGEPTAQLTNVRAVANAVEPALRLHELAPMTEIGRGFERFQATLVRIALFVSGVSLLLSLAGIYAVMSFAVSRRTREIGIRVALGADARRVTLAVFRRPLAQLGSGILVGAIIITALVQRLLGGISPGEAAALIGYTATMTAICMLACVVPTRRALSVQPTEALRAEE